MTDINKLLKKYQHIYTREVVLYVDILYDNIRLNAGYNGIRIYDSNDYNKHCIYVDKNINFRQYNIEVYPYIDYKTIDEMKRENIEYIKKNNNFLNIISKYNIIIAKFEKENDKYYMKYYINMNNNIDTYQPMIISIVGTNKKENIINNYKKGLDIIMKKYPEIIKENENFNCLKNTTQLYNYQKQDVYWMRHIEKLVYNNENDIKISYNIMYPILDGSKMIYNDIMIPIHILKDDLEQIMSYKFYGGNIISSCGLGKSLISLTYILEDETDREKYNHFVLFGDNCNYFYKRGLNKGTNCINKSLDGCIYCIEHIHTLFIEKRELVFRNLQEFDINDYIINIDRKTYFKTNATVIFCPTQLCDQWIREYYDKYINDKRIVMILTADQYRNIKIADILFADIVVISYNFLTNNNYIGGYYKIYENENKNENKNENENENKNENKNENENENREDAVNKLLCNKFKSLDVFYWKRIILDEAHEIQNMHKGNYIKSIIVNLKSLYKWNITGTPFANGIDSFMNIMSYNTSYNPTDNDKIFKVENITCKELLNDGVDSDIIEKSLFLFRRNTDKSIKNEYAGNTIINTTKLLTFTQQERNIYDSYLSGHNKFSEYLIKLCCHPELDNNTKDLIKHCKDLNELQEVMLSYNKDLLDKEINSIKLYEIQEEDYIKQINELDNIELEHRTDEQNRRLEDTKTLLGNIRRSKTNHKKQVDTIERTYNYLKTAIETLKDTSDTNCPICLDTIDVVTITKCGHKFCWDCLYETYKSKQSYGEFKCPTCNMIITNKDIYLLKDIQDINIDTSEIGEIVNNIKSTKIGNIIYYLKTQLKKDDKVIIFSQWDELLHKVGLEITKYKLKIVYCNGSLYQRNKAIKSFCNDSDIQIIMLSSRNSASGINLTIANKVILLEPIYGSSEYRREIESQSIGRVDRLFQTREIEVVRFIIKDTIEEDIINDNIDSEQIKLLKI